MVSVRLFGTSDGAGEPTVEAGVPGALALHEPRWLVSALLAAVATGLFCWPAWPGYMSYDSMLAYSQAIDGVQTMVWPPLHTYLFAISRALGADAWGVFVFQTFAIFFGVNLILHLMVRSRRLALGLCLAFVAAIAWMPTEIGVLLTQWRDVTTTSFSLLGFAAWLLAGRYRSTAAVIVAVGLFGCAAALRYNTLPLIAPILALMIWRPLPPARPTPRLRIIVALAIAVSLGLAWASTHWRLPDFRKLPDANLVMVTQQFDLIGISACAGASYLPPAMTHGQPVSGAEIRAGYDPRHLRLSLAAIGGGLRVDKLGRSEADGALAADSWRRAVAAQGGCYLWHRAQVMREQMGLSKDVFYPTHGVMHPNPYGLALAHPDAAARVNAYIRDSANGPTRRAIWLYVLALPVAVAAAWKRRSPGLLICAWLLGAYAYVAALFIASPAADARYIFPSNTVCLLVLVLGLGVLATKPPVPETP